METSAVAEKYTGPKTFLTEYYEKNSVVLGKESFQFFAWYYLRQHLDSGIAPYQGELFDQLQDLRPGQSGLFLYPRGHGKSTLISFAHTLWHVCYRTKRHIGIISSTAELAKKFLGKISTELKHNRIMQRDFGDLSGADKVGNKEVWTQSKVRTANQVVLFAMGTNGSVRGLNESLPEHTQRDFVGRDRKGRALYDNTGSYRPDLMIFDDIIETKWLKTKKVRDDVWDWFWSTAYPSIDADRGNMIMVGTTLHDDDIISRLYRDRVRTQAWIKVKKPACDGFDKHCNPINCLWKEYWGQPDRNKPLDEQGRLLPWEEAQYRLKHQGGKGVYYLSRLWWRRIEIGKKAFAQEYLLDPLADGLKMFDRSDVRYYIPQGMMISAAQEQAIISSGIKIDTLPDDLIAVTSVDPASSRGQKAIDNDSDFSVVSTVGYSPRMRRFYLLDVDRVRATPAVVMQILLRHYMVYNREYDGKMYTDTQKGEHVKGWPCEHMGILVESVGYQKALAIMLDELATSLGMYPKIVEVKRNKADKLTRATSASPLFERGMVYWPLMLGSTSIKSDFEEALHEFDRFPEAEHDDSVDSICDSLNFLNRMSLSLNRGLAAQVVMREMLRSSPEIYAYVKEKETYGVDVQDALQQFHERR